MGSICGGIVIQQMVVHSTVVVGSSMDRFRQAVSPSKDGLSVASVGGSANLAMTPVFSLDPEDTIKGLSPMDGGNRFTDRDGVKRGLDGDGRGSGDEAAVESCEECQQRAIFDNFCSTR